MALIRQAGHHPDMDLWTRPLDVVVRVAADCFPHAEARWMRADRSR